MSPSRPAPKIASPPPTATTTVKRPDSPSASTSPSKSPAMAPFYSKPLPQTARSRSTRSRNLTRPILRRPRLPRRTGTARASTVALLMETLMRISRFSLTGIWKSAVSMLSWPTLFLIISPSRNRRNTPAGLRVSLPIF